MVPSVARMLAIDRTATNSIRGVVQQDGKLTLASIPELAQSSRSDGDWPHKAAHALKRISVACTESSHLLPEEGRAGRAKATYRAHGHYIGSLVAMAELERFLFDAHKSYFPLAKAPGGLRELLEREGDQLLPTSLNSAVEALIHPNGINLRNLLWHGFAGDDTPYEYCPLLAFCLASGERHLGVDGVPEFVSASCDDLPQAEHRLEHRGVPMDAQLSEPERQEMAKLVRASEFVPRQHKEPLAYACEHLNGSLFACVALPALEHSLLRLFSQANGAPSKALAKFNEYFVTLDGFGQMDKHDLILGDTAADSRNALLDELGPGYSNLLRDLFLQDHGPKLRGKIAHREVDISDGANPAPRSVAALTLCFAALSWRYSGGALSNSQKPQMAFRGEELAVSWTPAFSPRWFLLFRQRCAWRALIGLIEHSHRISLQMEDCGTRLTMDPCQGKAGAGGENLAELLLPEGTSKASLGRHAACKKLEDRLSLLLIPLHDKKAIEGEIARHLLSSSPGMQCPLLALDGMDEGENAEAAKAPSECGHTKALLGICDEVECAIREITCRLDDLVGMARRREARSSQRRTLIKGLQARTHLARFFACVLVLESRCEAGEAASEFARRLHAACSRVRSNCQAQQWQLALENASSFLDTKMALRELEHR